jgi:hypothetical protein
MNDMMATSFMEADYDSVSTLVPPNDRNRNPNPTPNLKPTPKANPNYQSPNKNAIKSQESIIKSQESSHKNNNNYSDSFNGANGRSRTLSSDKDWSKTPSKKLEIGSPKRLSTG